MQNSKQTVIVLQSDNSVELKTAEFASYISERFNIQLAKLTFSFPQHYLPLHHTYPFPFYKRTAEQLKERLNKLMEAHDSVMVIFAYNRKHLWQKNRISDILMACRDLRIPYIGVPEDGDTFKGLKKIALPIGFLVEEKEKAPLSNVFSEYCGASIEMIQPKDKGKRAMYNVEFIQKILQNYQREPLLIKGTKSSFKIEFEALQLAKERHYDIVFISGSREYTLDDIFFRPKEGKILWKANIPILIINPRDDIYVLCGN